MTLTREGTIGYFHGQGDGRRQFGSERFVARKHPDGQRTLVATCEIDAGVVADRHVLREVIYTMDATLHPADCFVRLHRNGTFLGSGWFLFSPGLAECEAVNAEQGRFSQRITTQGRTPSFGAHALVCDMTHLARFDHGLSQRVQPIQGAILSSLEHDGCSGPLLSPVDFAIEYVGQERIEVPAGEFETDHYRILLDGGRLSEHPTEELWCLPDEFTFVRVRVGGYMNSSFELMEYRATGDVAPVP